MSDISRRAQARAAHGPLRQNDPVEQTFATTRCVFGVATRDVTPPVGIYARSWGAATHEVAEGVHRPFVATAAVFSPLGEDGPELALVALDIGWLQHGPDEVALRESIRERTGLGEAELLVAMSHTHAGANANSQLVDRPGVELIQPYLDHLADEITSAILEARELRNRSLRHLRPRPLRACDEPRPLGRGSRAICVRVQPRRSGRRHAARRARLGRRRHGARDALQLRVPPDDARVGQPAPLPRLHRCGPRGARARVRRAGALPPRCLRRAGSARRLRRRHGCRRPERPPARARGRSCDRELFLQPGRGSSTPGSSPRAPTSARGSTRPGRTLSATRQAELGAAAHPRRARPEGATGDRRESRRCCARRGTGA